MDAALVVVMMNSVDEGRAEARMRPAVGTSGPGALPARSPVPTAGLDENLRRSLLRA